MVENKLAHNMSTDEFDTLFTKKMNAHNFYYVVLMSGSDSEVVGAYMDDDLDTEVEDVMDALNDENLWLRNGDGIEVYYSDHGSVSIYQAFTSCDGRLEPVY